MRVRWVGVLVAVCVLCLAVAAGAYATGRLPLGSPDGQRAAAAAGPGPAAAPAPSPSPTPDDQLAAAQAIVAPATPPVRLLVPAIGVDAAVEAVGVDGQGGMGTPARAEDVAWFQPGARPGDVGDAVIAGHLDWTSGPAVFAQLGKLRRGDAVAVVRQNGTQARFVVDSTWTMPYDASTNSLFTNDGPPSLTLITCAGTWDRQRGTYLQRLVVHASLAASTVAPGPSGSPRG
jgi:LPXTG-site transpeptidase (sortase) family protein